MEAYLLDWLNLGIRWLHFIAGIAWIGASFYFVMLDNSLSKPAKQDDIDRGVGGELWAVHGGGVYHSQKYLIGPVGEPLAEKLHWSKWEAYTTWLSGMALLALIYWFGANTYLIDRQVQPMTPPVAIAISAGVLAGGWFVYDFLCRALRGKDNLLALCILIGVCAAAYVLFQIFSARAAYIHVGAMLGSIMVANVFFHIIPGQKRMVAQIRAGETPDAGPGIIGKQRSVHNTYFTLPVLFIMISNHYPMTYAHPRGWLVLICIMLAGVLVRQYFVMRHSQPAKPILLVMAAALLLAMIWYLKPETIEVDRANPIGEAEVLPIMQARCVACHAAQPVQPGIAEAPLGILLETYAQTLKHAERVAFTVQTKYMPIGNLTGMTDEERTTIATWHAQVQH